MSGDFQKGPAEKAVCMLAEMFRAQRGFAERFYDADALSWSEREKWLKEMCVAGMVEETELLNELNWKHWKKAKKPIDLAKARAEVADQMAFLMNKAMLLGMDAAGLYAEYMKKVGVNHDRQAAGY